MRVNLSTDHRLRSAWLMLVAALALHVIDEAATGFLDVYNPTVQALRESLAMAFAALMLGNGVAHTMGTIAGRTVATVRFERPMPGFWSSPLLMAAAVRFLLVARRSRVV